MLVSVFRKDLNINGRFIWSHDVSASVCFLCASDSFGIFSISLNIHYVIAVHVCTMSLYSHDMALLCWLVFLGICLVSFFITFCVARWIFVSFLSSYFLVFLPSIQSLVLRVLLLLLATQFLSLSIVDCVDSHAPFTLSALGIDYRRSIKVCCTKAHVMLAVLLPSHFISYSSSCFSLVLFIIPTKKEEKKMLFALM